MKNAGNKENERRDQKASDRRNHSFLERDAGDDEFGGYYGFLDYDLNLDKKAEKGCILNSRITWFFSNAYTLLKDESLLEEAKHGYDFLKDHCLDKEYGGIYWSLNYDGTPKATQNIPTIRHSASTRCPLTMRPAGDARKPWSWRKSCLL